MYKFWFMMNLQNFNSYMCMFVIEFHDLILLILLIIMLFILYIIMFLLMNNFINKNILHNQMIEIIWTFIPMIILLFMVYPSLKILYWLEEFSDNVWLSVKIIGHQWYWSYEYSDFFNLEMNSFMMTDYSMGMFRLLDVDNHFILPVNVYIRGMVTSVDVIHSWAMPTLSVKVDAIPGRINQFVMNMVFLGIYYGQCSEICGLNHSFMPIVLEVVSFNDFCFWLLDFNKDII